jgi:1,6-anhydro-N-acetylmuramate kinase
VNFHKSLTRQALRQCGFSPKSRYRAAGGQGAPLVPFRGLFFVQERKKSPRFRTSAGIANVTFLPATANRDLDIIAFDTGPGNMLIVRFVFCGQKKTKF